MRLPIDTNEENKEMRFHHMSLYALVSVKVIKELTRVNLILDRGGSRHVH